MEKKQPTRQCIGCGEKKDKRSLIRVIRTPEGAVLIDETHRQNGRGAYLCRDVKCLQTAQKRKALARALKTEITQDLYEKLALQLSEAGNAE